MPEIARPLVALLWWGPLQYRLRGVLCRFLEKKGIIRLGPLRGRRFSGGCSQLLGIYEMPVERAIKKCLHPGDVFYDVGANRGYFSVLGAVICGAAGHVYSFEPVPDNVQRIRQNLAGMYNCAVVDKAVSSVSGESYMVIGDGVRSSLVTRQQDDTISVAQITLDEFVQSHRLPNLIKIDVEGAERDVIAGAKGLLGRPDAPALIVELHDQDSDRKLTMELSKYGYTLSPLASRFRRRRDYPHHILAEKRTT